MSERFVFWRAFVLQIILFFCILPYIVLMTTHGLDVLFRLSPMFDNPSNLLLACCSFIIGSVFTFWSNYYVFVVGRGTPLEVAGQAVKQTKYLLRTGPYAFVRNPMAFGFVMMYVAGIGFILNSWMTVPLILLSFLFLVIYLRTWEEKLLEQRFGSAYLEYKSQVPTVIPRLVPLRVDSQEVAKRLLPPVSFSGLAAMAVMWAALGYCLFLDWEVIMEVTALYFSIEAWISVLLYSTWYGFNIGLTVLALGGMPEFNVGETIT